LIKVLLFVCPCTACRIFSVEDVTSNKKRERERESEISNKQKEIRPKVTSLFEAYVNYSK
jgi:signal transduction histidine kinase